MTDAKESEWISDSVLGKFECLGLSANDDVALWIQQIQLPRLGRVLHRKSWKL